MNSKILRTPEHRFIALPDYAFPPNYCMVRDADYGELRMHYVDVNIGGDENMGVDGANDRPIALLLHGEPTWSYLYRKMIPLIAAAGFRVIAPDYIGFGRSDKLPLRDDYTYQKFVDWLCEFIERLDLRNITLVCQDWGGPIGLRTLSQLVDRFDAVVATNTLLPNCEPPSRGIESWPGTLIENWVDTCRNANDLPISELVAGTCVQRPSADILAAYDAPFPDARHKSAALQITCCIPTQESSVGIAENRAAWKVLEQFDKPFVTAFSDSDPSTKAWEKVFQQRVPGAKNQPHCEIKSAGHFVQEEQPEWLAQVVVETMHFAKKSDSVALRGSGY